MMNDNRMQQHIASTANLWQRRELRELVMVKVRSLEAGLAWTHIAEGDNRNIALLRVRRVLDRIDDERQQVADVRTQARPCHQRQLAHSQQHARHHAALAAACAGCRHRCVLHPLDKLQRFHSCLEVSD